MVRQKLRELLSLEFNCNPDDFMKSKNILTVSELHEGRRAYSTEKYFFHMVTMGGNAVVTADECMQDFLRAYIDGKQGHYLFEIPNLLPVEHELNKYGYTLTQTYHMFLSCKQVEIARDYSIKWFYGTSVSNYHSWNIALNCGFKPTWLEIGAKKIGEIKS